jgi:hypothetical protein
MIRRHQQSITTQGRTLMKRRRPDAMPAAFRRYSFAIARQLSRHYVALRRRRRLALARSSPVSHDYLR